MSLVCIGKIIERYKVTIPDFENKILKDFCEFYKINAIKEITYFNEFKIVSKNDKKTVVVMCNVKNLDKFFELINKKYNLSIEYSPLHVTLYKILGGRGIFLTNSDDIKQLTRNITNPLGVLLKSDR